MPSLRAQYLFHPESPGCRLWVVRGFWGRLLKPKHFATAREVEIYHLFWARID